MKRFSRVFLFCLLAISLAHAQANAASSADSPAAAPAASPTATATEAAPQAPILEYSPPPAQYARAKAYSHAHYTHFFINALYALLVLLFVLRWRVAQKFRDLAERVSSRRFVQLIIFAPLTLLTINFLTIPSDVWDEVLQRAYGLSVQNWPAWFTDWITNQIVMLIIGTILTAILYFAIRRSPRRWWFYFWLASIPVLLIVFLIQPIVIDPLFFKFTPLAATQPVLVSEIQTVTHRGGIEIPTDRMFLMNASSKTTGLNAYVTGFGSSKRVVIWDNTIAKATIPETLFVFGHEMGHYVLFHIPKETAILAGILLAALYLGYRLSNWMLARWGYQWGIRDLKDWASLPALIFLISLMSLLTTPATNAVSRHFEHEADRYGLEVIHGIVPNANQVAAHYFEKSGEMNLSDPDPTWFIKAWFFDHPTRPERVHFVATYDPWSQGKEAEYVK
jgi:STE24 endopeptidase